MAAYKRSNIFVFIIVISFCLIFFSGCIKDSPEEQTYTIDLDGDGRDEIIRVKRLKVEVLNSSRRKLGDFEIFDYSDELEFVDLNKDGNKQIVVWTQGKEGYDKTLMIYGLRNNRLYEILKIEVRGYIDTDFYSSSPAIKTGWTTWIWDGERFVQGF